MATLISTIMRVAINFICLEKLNDFNENEGIFYNLSMEFRKI